MKLDGIVTFESHQLRIFAMFFVGLLLFSTLAIQLWYVQIVRKENYDERSRKQSVRRIRLSPVRGRILFANGDELAGNRVSYDVKFHLAEMSRPTRDAMIKHILAEADRISNAIGRDNTLNADMIRKHINIRPGLAMTVFKDLSEDELAKLEEMMPRVEGIEISPESVRVYPNGSLASQTIGYVSLKNPPKNDDEGKYFYYEKEYAGISGIELAKDSELRGFPGSRLVVVNNVGFIHSELESPVMPIHGKDIQLTLDIKAQRKAEELLEGYTGAIVLMNAKTGAVLAMASSPTFDCSDFIPVISSRRFNQINNNQGKPFLNRVTSSSYMPGSTIKVLVALAMLENGFSPFATTECKGRTKHGYGNGIGCLSITGHGFIDMFTAIKKSCNVYFVDNAVALGITPLSKVYKSAGIGEKIFFEINDSRGILPPVGNWNSNETAYVGIGQGRVEVTPLQAASYFAAIANGGTLMRPYVIQRIYDNSSGTPSVTFETKPEVRGHLAAKPENIEFVKKAMFAVVNEDGGTGARARIGDPSIKFYGKTGTADYVNSQGAYKNVWFAGTAEKDGELYTIAVVIEHGESGGRTSAPIAGKLIKSFLSAPVPEEDQENL